MTWDVEGTDEFAEWFASLDESTREKVSATVTMLEELGPTLGHPQSSQIRRFAARPDAGIENPAQGRAVPRALRVRPAQDSDSVIGREQGWGRPLV
jgi:hypothetical protein